MNQEKTTTVITLKNRQSSSMLIHVLYLSINRPWPVLMWMVRLLRASCGNPYLDKGCARIHFRLVFSSCYFLFFVHSAHCETYKSFKIDCTERVCMAGQYLQYTMTKFCGLSFPMVSLFLFHFVSGRFSELYASNFRCAMCSLSNVNRQELFNEWKKK